MSILALNRIPVPRPSPLLPLDFSHLDRPEEAVSSPFLEPMLTVFLLERLPGSKSVHVEGKISDEVTKRPVVTDFLNKGKGFQVDLSGELDGLPVTGQIRQENLITIRETADIGTPVNHVDISHRYNIFTGGVSTAGKIGSVNVNVNSKPDDDGNYHLAGKLNGTSFSVEVRHTESGLEAKGELGGNPIQGTLTYAGNSRFLLQESIGPVAVLENVTVE
ncbi:MAG: hypothetical protein HYU64_08110 [Armatimonadetes bacterium]|nr:hypothetical protein [Armatimonadota bacterium]